MRRITGGIAFASCFIFGTASAQELPSLALARAYVSGLSQLEAAREDNYNQSIRDKTDRPDEPIVQYIDCVQGMTSMQLVLSNFTAELSQIATRDSNTEKAKAAIIDQNKVMTGYYKSFGDICEAFVTGPKPDVDYKKLGAMLPKLTAYIDDGQNQYMNFSPMAFVCLVNLKIKNDKGRAYRLVVTKDERDALVNMIEEQFGDKLKQAHQDAFVGSASLLEGFLKKDVKGSDEP